MAQNDRRRTSRPVYRTNGAAAYDVRRNMEYGNAARRVQEPERRPRPKPRPKAKLGISMLSVAGFFAVACMLLFVVCGYVQLFEESAQIRACEQELNALREANEVLQAKYDSAVDMETIREQALALGMTVPNSKQTVYLKLEGADRAVISDGSRTLLQTAFDAIGRSIRTVLEYFMH